MLVSEENTVCKRKNPVDYVLPIHHPQVKQYLLSYTTITPSLSSFQNENHLKNLQHPWVVASALAIFEQGKISKTEFLMRKIFVSRFENMKKEQEEEAAKRVAEERTKRATHDQQSASNGNGHAKPKPQEAPVVSPQPAPVQVTNPSIYQNLGNQFANHPTSPSAAKEEETNRIVGGVNVSSLLRERKTSSSSSKHEEEDEWGENHHSSYQYQPPQQRSPSPIPTAGQSSNEGIKCIARYSYQKSKYLFSFFHFP